MNLFELSAKIGLDDREYKAGIQEAKTGFGGLVANVKSGVANVAKVGGQIVATGAKVAGAAVAVGAAGITALSKLAIDGYAEYEQLVGGVETLFKDSADQVQQYADNAYQTAGMSANEYMNTVTSFSASLLQGLGGDTEAAAKIANRAITDMSDNANKMGTDMSMIQNAYQGFAKQNYTMLDNLKLGYGGTASEMARLINDSGVLGDSIEVTAETVNSVSFDKIIEAIGVVQDRMGITGTTAKEASSTIAGSISSMKAAWQNLLVGFADPDQDLDALLGNVIDSAVTVANNIGPRIAKLLPRLVSGVSGLVKNLGKKIGPLLQQLLPGLLTGAVDLVGGLASELPEILRAIGGAIEAAAPYIMESLGKLLDPLLLKMSGGALDFQTLASGVRSAFEGLFSALQTIWTAVGQPVFNMISGAAQNAIGYIANNMPQIRETVSAVFSGIVTLWKTSLKPALQGILDFVTGVFTLDFQKAFSGLGTFVESIFSGLETAVKIPINNVISVINKFISGLNQLKIPDFVPGIGGQGVNIPLIPKLYEGGILKKGQIGLLEGAGDEAVVPLHNNKKWITAVADDMQTALSRNQLPKLHIVNNITVNGANYADEESLAEKISEIINFNLEKEVATFA